MRSFLKQPSSLPGHQVLSPRLHSTPSAFTASATDTAQAKESYSNDNSLARAAAPHAHQRGHRDLDGAEGSLSTWNASNKRGGNLANTLLPILCSLHCLTCSFSSLRFCTWQLPSVLLLQARCEQGTLTIVPPDGS